jgi:hypothetical protein
VITFGVVPLESAWGSKSGGSGAPSGVKDARLTVGGWAKGTTLLKVARRSRGTGRFDCEARMPCQLTGRSRLPVASTAARLSVASAVQGGESAKQSAW